jgi:hypothetical protein
LLDSLSKFSPYGQKCIRPALSVAFSPSDRNLRPRHDVSAPPGGIAQIRGCGRGRSWCSLQAGVLPRTR